MSRKGYYKKSEKISQFNHKSPKHLRKYLYEDLACTPNNKFNTPTGKTGIGYDAVVDLIKRYPENRTLLQRILYLKDLDKTLRFTDYKLNPFTFKSHNNFSQLKAKTARITSSRAKGIGLQQIPKDQIGQMSLRKAVIADKNKILINFDFEAQEIRLMASLSEDRKLIHFLEQGSGDLHSEITKKVYSLNCPIHLVKKLYPHKRAKIKSIIFGITYGGSVKGLAESNHCEVSFARKVLQELFNSFPDLKAYFKSQAEFSNRLYIKNIAGFKQWFNLPRSKSERGRRERVAKNFGVQSLGSIVLKICMIEINSLFTKLNKSNKVKSKILSLRHDELIVEVPEAIHEEIILDIKTIIDEKITERLEDLFQFRSVALPIEMYKGKCWDKTMKQV